MHALAIVLIQLASSPGHSQFFNVFQRITLKNWEWPGDEAKFSCAIDSMPMIKRGLYCIILYYHAMAKCAYPWQSAHQI